MKFNILVFHAYVCTLLVDCNSYAQLIGRFCKCCRKRTERNWKFWVVLKTKPTLSFPHTPTSEVNYTVLYSWKFVELWLVTCVVIIPAICLFVKYVLMKWTDFSRHSWFDTSIEDCTSSDNSCTYSLWWLLLHVLLATFCSFVHKWW